MSGKFRWGSHYSVQLGMCRVHMIPGLADVLNPFCQKSSYFLSYLYCSWALFIYCLNPMSSLGRAFWFVKWANCKYDKKCLFRTFFKKKQLIKGDVVGRSVSFKKVCWSPSTHLPPPQPMTVTLFSNRVFAHVIKLKQGLTGLGRALIQWLMSL